jgi:predicted ribosomally synthesized peptide with nif11-like leader
MSREAVLEFVVCLTQDAALRGRVDADPSGASQVSIAAQAGFRFTAEELRSITSALQFLHAAGTDPVLGGQVRGADDADIVALGAERGWKFSADDLEAIAEASTRELTDDELELVAGGFSFPNVKLTPPYGIPIPYPKW